MTTETKFWKKKYFTMIKACAITRSERNKDLSNQKKNGGNRYEENQFIFPQPVQFLQPYRLRMIQPFQGG